MFIIEYNILDLSLDKVEKDLNKFSLLVVM